MLPTIDNYILSIAEFRGLAYPPSRSIETRAWPVSSDFRSFQHEAQIGDSRVQNVRCRRRPGSGAEDDFPDRGTKTAFELPIRTAFELPIRSGA